MTWTYGGNPAANNRDAVRFALGDNESKKPLVTDEEIAYALAQESNNIYRAAARCARTLAAKYAREDTVRTSTFSTERHHISGQFYKLASELEKKAAGSSFDGFIMPSLSQATKDTYFEDSDIPQPAVKRGIHNNPSSSSSSSSDGV